MRSLSPLLLSLKFVLCYVKDKLQQIAERARSNRKNELNGGRLIGHCYENAKATSKLLTEESINHGLYYVGIVEDIIMGSEWTREQVAEASRSSEYDRLPTSKVEGTKLEFPSTIEELPDMWNHWVIGVEANGKLYCVEPCAEARDRFREAHASPWPHEEYLILDNSLRYDRRF